MGDSGTITPLSFSVHALAQAVEQSPVSIVLTDPAGTIAYVNPWFSRVTGYSREEVLGQNPRVLKSGHTTAEEYAAMFRHLESGQIWRGEFKNLRKNGEAYWEEAVIVPVFEKDGRILHYMALKSDVTARREAERAQQGMIGLLHFCNRSHGRVDFLRGVIEYLRAFAEVKAVQIRVGEGPWRDGDTSYQTGVPDSSLLRGASVSIPLTHAEKNLGRMDFLPEVGQKPSEGEVAVWREMVDTVAVTLAKYNADEALRESEQRYRDVQKMEAIGQLAGGVAHDYNNILTATLLHLALLRETAGLPVKVLDTIDELEVEAKRAAKLTRQLLLFSRRQVGKIERIDLRAVVCQLQSMLARVLGEDIQLDFPHGVRGAWIDGDAGMMEQILMNLCVNARDAMEPRGGTLTVRVEGITITEAELTGRPQARSGRFVVLRVADTGEGMDAATQTRIFEPFFTTKSVGKGTGLGLATVYGIVERHAGWIEVESAVGQGTEFRVYLPAQTSGVEVGATDHLLRERTGRGEAILFVEDDALVRATGASVLRMQGYEVFDVADGLAAKKVWAREKSRLRLLLTDLVLPGGMTGRDMIVFCREQRPELPVIVTSGYGAMKSQLEIGDLREIVFIAKPFQLGELVRAVQGSLVKAKAVA